MTLELPACLMADRVTVALAIVSGLATEAMLASHPDAVTGAGLVVGLVLLTWQRIRTLRRPRRLQISPAGAQIEFRSVDGAVPATGSRARVLGSTVVLHWYGLQGSAGPAQGTLWITSWDLPEASLRALRVALVAGSASTC